MLNEILHTHIYVNENNTIINENNFIHSQNTRTYLAK